MQHARTHLTFFLIFLCIGAVIIGLVSLGGRGWQTSSPLSLAIDRSLGQDSSAQQSSLVPTPTPFPFQDMTIPFLRLRQYPSQLDELKPLSTSGTFQSFLTSFTSDGLNINGLLTIPIGEMPTEGWPAIVFIHGYIPPPLYRTTEKYTQYVAGLASKGFVVFKIDLRGHGNSQGEATGAYYSSDYIIDVLSAKAALSSSDFVNPDQVGLWGHSMAGNIVLRSLAVDRTIRAGVIWAGAVYTYQDLQEYGIQDNSYRPPNVISNRQRRRQELFDAHGQFDQSSDFWGQVSAINYLTELTSSIQVHHAVNDEVVSVEYSRNLKRLLDSAQVSNELFEYQSGGHNLTDPAFGPAMLRTVEFFQREL